MRGCLFNLRLLAYLGAEFEGGVVDLLELEVVLHLDIRLSIHFLDQLAHLPQLAVVQRVLQVVV
jgi:hypothetical protein